MQRKRYPHHFTSGAASVMGSRAVYDGAQSLQRVDVLKCSDRHRDVSNVLSGYRLGWQQA